MKKTKPNYIVYYEIIFIAMLFVSSFIIRIYPIHYSHWWDECIYLQHAEIISGLRENTFNEFHLRPPLLPVILSAGFLVYESVFIASVIMSLFGAIGVLFVYLLAKKLTGEKTAALAATFMALTPFIMKNARYIMTDIPSLTLITAAFYFFVLFHENKDKKYLAISGIMFSLAVLMKFTIGTLLPVFLLYAFFYNKPQKNTQWIISIVREYKLFIVPAFLTFLPYLIWSWLFYGSPLYTLLHAIIVVSDFNEPVTFYISNFVNIFSLIVFIGFILSMFFIFFDFYKSRKWDKNIMIMVFWFISFTIFVSIGAHKELRYLIPAVTPVIILSAYGFQRLINNKNAYNIAILIIVILSVISFAPSFERLNEPFINTGKSEDIVASEFIKENLPKDYVIYTNMNYPVFAYYTGYKTIPLYISDDSFFHDYKSLIKGDGLIIIYKDIKYPGIEWAKYNRELRLVKEYENFSIYEYKNDETNNIE